MKLYEHAPLRDLNTLGLAACARWLVTLEAPDEVAAIRCDPRWAGLPRLVLGGGSNVLFTCDFDGLVVQNRLRGISVTDEGESWLLHVAAGENWHELVRYTLKEGMPGLENLALIPGCVGAAPVQNIGAYGVELAHFCAYVDTLRWDDGQAERIAAADCRFGYRDSCFKHEYQESHLIMAVGLRLPKVWQPRLAYGPLAALGAQATPQGVFDIVCTTRMAKLPDPAVLGNAGSFFKNPVIDQAQAARLKAAHPAMPLYPAGEGQAKLAAGWLIDQCDLKGFAIGQAAVHQEQALVLVNRGGATAHDLLALAAHVRDTVAARFGVELEHEVRFMGARGETFLHEVMA